VDVNRARARNLLRSPALASQRWTRLSPRALRAAAARRCAHGSP
jgi:hypothetical protein